jgi:antitoxin component YwqK of YwqJK toxin-antitoxin module
VYGNLTQQKTSSTEENATYKKNQRHGPATCYIDGVMYYDLNYHKGKRHLAQKHYYVDGTLYVEEYLLYGKLFGLKKRYHPNGSIKHIENYSDNKLHGERMVFNEDGKLVVHSTYKRGSIIKSHPINITT